MAVLPAAAYGGLKDASEAWAAGVLRLDARPPAAGAGRERRKSLQHLQELWEECTAIMVYDGRLPPTAAARLAGAGLLPPGEAR